MASLVESLTRRLHRFAFLRSLGKRLFRHRIVRQPFHGGVICLDAVEHSWAWTGSVRLETWDRPIQDRLLALSRECATMIDVGSNIGTMTLAVALRNPAIRVVSVEPNARAVELLRRSVALNRLESRITIVDAVAAQDDGEVGFEETGSTTGHVASGADGSAKKRTVSFVRLVADAAGDGRCLLKVDVEGFETRLLAQLPHVTARQRVILFVELHARGFNGLGDPRACVRMLRESGAVLKDLDGRRIDAVEDWTNRIDTLQLEARWP